MGQLAQEKAERPTRTFGANTEKNPKEECKAVPTRGQKRAQEEGKAEEEDQSEERRTKKKEEENIVDVLVICVPLCSHPIDILGPQTEKTVRKEF